MPSSHPLRAIRSLVDEALSSLSPEFTALYARRGRPSIPPERLLWALLLQASYAVRSERQLVDRIEFDLLFRWFVGLGIDDPVWDATSFTRNRDRLLAGEIAAKLLPRFWRSRWCGGCCRASTSGSTGRCSRPGRP